MVVKTSSRKKSRKGRTSRSSKLILKGRELSSKMTFLNQNVYNNNQTLEYIIQLLQN